MQGENKASDQTHKANYSIAPAGVARVSAEGFVWPLAKGEADITIEAGGLKQIVHVVVHDAKAEVTVLGRNLPTGKPAPQWLIHDHPLEMLTSPFAAPTGGDHFHFINHLPSPSCMTSCGKVLSSSWLKPTFSWNAWGRSYCLRTAPTRLGIPRTGLPWLTGSQISIFSSTRLSAPLEAYQTLSKNVSGGTSGQKTNGRGHRRRTRLTVARSSKRIIPAFILSPAADVAALADPASE